MWIFTKYGFFSVVCAKEVDTKTRKERPSQWAVMVRARDKSHLLNILPLVNKHYEKEEERDVVETKDTDYRYRIFVTKSVWRKVVVLLTDDIDYCNFKDAVKDGGTGAAYYQALTSVWSRMHDLQEPPKGGLKDLWDPTPRTFRSSCDKPNVSGGAATLYHEKEQAGRAPIPEGVYYVADNDNFYRMSKGIPTGCGSAFYRMWKHRGGEFPTTPPAKKKAARAQPAPKSKHKKKPE